MAQSGLVIVVDEAERVVAPHRLRHDPVAALGVPAHITMLFPFRPHIDDATDELVRSVTETLEPFEVTFESTDRFPDGVLFLAPEPEGRLRHVMRRLMTTFPEHPPYGGEIADPTPHLTIGMSLDEAAADALDEVIRPQLPIRTRANRLTLLLADDDGRWAVDRHWPFGSG